jgi:hypothetical protein
MPKDNCSAFHALDPFFSIVMEGLSKYTDVEHYFDTLADDVLFEFRYLIAGWPEIFLIATSFSKKSLRS